MPCAPQYGWSGVNNGVMMWHLDRIRAHLAEYWAEVMKIVNEKAYRSPRFAEYHKGLPVGVMNHPDGMQYYDQDIMGIASFDWPERFYKLSQAFNWRWKLNRDFPRDSWGSEPGVCIEHFSNSDFNVEVGQGRATLFQYWRDYRRVAPGSAKRRDRSSGAPTVRWDWELGTGRSLGPLKKKT